MAIGLTPILRFIHSAMVSFIWGKN